ncbi:threonine synthase [Aeromonas dhakensis]
MDECLGLDVLLPGPLAKLPQFSHNLPAEFAWLRAFLLA